MPDMKSAATLLASLSSADLNVYPYRCAVVRNRHASCMRCAQACTSGAISIEEGAVTVDPELCVGCGTCATVCPTCALEARHPADAELAMRAHEALEACGDTLVVMCDSMWRRNVEAVDPARAVRVTCLGRMEESVLVDAVARGAKRVLLVHGPCECCPRSVGMHTYTEVVDNANLLLETWGSAVRVEVREKLPKCVRLEGAPRASEQLGGAFDESRREAFSQVGHTVAGMFADGAADGGASVGEMADKAEAAQASAQTGTAGSAPLVSTAPVKLKTMLDGTLPHFLPDRRERLLDSLAELGEPACDAALETRLWGRVSIDVSRCKTCLMCATFCPTGAISKIMGDNGAVTLEHRPADCVKCRCCTDVCPTDALTLFEDVLASEVANGAVTERFDLPPIRDGRGGPHSMLGALKKIIHCDQLYER